MCRRSDSGCSRRVCRNIESLRKGVFEQGTKPDPVVSRVRDATTKYFETSSRVREKRSESASRKRLRPERFVESEDGFVPCGRTITAAQAAQRYAPSSTVFDLTNKFVYPGLPASDFAYPSLSTNSLITGAFGAIGAKLNPPAAAAAQKKAKTALPRTSSITTRSLSTQGKDGSDSAGPTQA